LSWLNLPHLPILPPPLTAKRLVIIPGNQPEEGIDGYGGKAGPGLKCDDGEDLDDDEGSN